MSHAIGAVRFPDSTVMFYEYDGTSDFVMNPLYLTEQEVHDNWRTFLQVDLCTNCTPEPVIIFSTYGNGFYWEGTACKEHHLILSGFEPFPYDEDEVDTCINGYPSWSPWVYDGY